MEFLKMKSVQPRPLSWQFRQEELTRSLKMPQINNSLVVQQIIHFF